MALKTIGEKMITAMMMIATIFQVGQSCPDPFCPMLAMVKSLHR
jgi:hypothetical protein